MLLQHRMMHPSGIFYIVSDLLLSFNTFLFVTQRITFLVSEQTQAAMYISFAISSGCAQGQGVFSVILIHLEGRQVVILQGNFTEDVWYVLLCK